MGRVRAVAAAMACWVVFLPLGLAQEVDPGAGGVAAMRIAHVAVEAGAVDLSVGAATVFAALDPATATGYRLVPAGDAVVTVTPAGTGVEAQGPPGAPAGTSFALQAGNYYTLVLIDEDAGPEDAVSLGGGASAYLIEDAMDAFPAAGQAWVRVVHALNGVSSLSARATPLDARGRADRSEGAQDAAVVSELAYGAHAEWVTLRAGAYALEHAAGAEGDLSFRTDVTLHGGTLYSMFVYGTSSDPSLLVAVDAVLRDTPLEATSFPETVP